MMCEFTSAFVERFGGVYEHSPWVAVRAGQSLTDMDNLEAVGAVMAKCVDTASASRQLELIRAHPDLAAELSPGGGLSTDSADEQASAGLDQCSPDELEQFRSLNRRYREKFGFPFVMAVRDLNRAKILEAFVRRLENNRATEVNVALREIHKIARLRLKAMATA